MPHSVSLLGCPGGETKTERIADSKSNGATAQPKGNRNSAMLGRRFGQATLAYMICALLLLAYLFSLQSRPLPLATYWTSILVGIAIVAWQSIHSAGDSTRVSIVLGEIVSLGFITHMLFVIPIPAGVFGRDIFTDLGALSAIAANGWPIPSDVPLLPLTRSVSEWPLLQFFGMICSKVLGIPLFSVTNPNNVLRWVPSVISLATPLCWFSTCKRMFGGTRVALIASLGSTLVFYNVMFHAWFVEETIAYALLFTFVLAFVVSIMNKRTKTRSRLLAVVLLIGLDFAHHLTFVFALLFLALAVAVPWLIKLARIVGKNTRSLDRAVSTREAGVMLVLAGILFASYLSYIGEPALKTLVSSLGELFKPNAALTVRTTGSPISPDRILLLTRLGLGFAFSWVMFMQVLRREQTLFWDLLGLLWGMIAGVVTAVDQVLIKSAGVGVLRMEGFAWPVVLMSGTYSIFRLKVPKRGAGILALFVVVNLLLIPGYIYDPGATPQYQLGEVRARYTLAEYSAAEWFPGGGRIVGDVTTYQLFGTLKQLDVVTDFQVFGGNLSGVEAYRWVVIRQENNHVVVAPGGSEHVAVVSPQVRNVLNASSFLSQVYSNGDVVVFWVNP